ncbi:MAG TPA: HNH endonuclease [Microscillaceae bacterium]|nr:HNH endonuclease [Microscillaceae bacterium]
MTLDQYLQRFKKLHVDHSRKNTLGSVAPHKPVLLLSIIQLIEDGVIESPQIYLTPELLATFKEYWEQLANPKFHSEIAVPFFYLKSDGFWTLVPHLGQAQALSVSKGLKSFNQLTQKVAYAELDKELFRLWQNSQHRAYFRQVLLDTYLDYNKNRFSTKVDYNQYIQTLETTYLEEDFETYQTRLIEENRIGQRDHRKREKFLEKEFIRSQLFPKTILKLYNHTCCISGLQVITDTSTTQTITMVDACHIEPFAQNRNNSIQNGIALTPTLHRAFDRGLIAIDDRYRVIVADNFQENTASRYNLSGFQGQGILLPPHEQFYPKIEVLKAHQKRFNL